MVDSDWACVPPIDPGVWTQHLELKRSYRDVRSAEGSAAERDGFIAVIESRSFLRDCMQRSLQSALSLQVVTFSTAWELERSHRDISARLIVLSLLDSSAESARACNFLSELLPSAPIIVLGGTNDADLARTVIGNGARGYIPWTMGFDIAVTAARFVLAGGTYVPVDIFLEKASFGSLSNQESRTISVTALSNRTTADHPVCSPVTRRELLVIQAIQQGKSNRMIAYQLNMCESTVKAHVRNIMKKLGARTRTGLAIKAQAMLNATKAAVSSAVAAEAA
jgi:DNA-binding NarL/FixJ family response regulator